VRILFFMQNLRGYFRVFEPLLRALGEGGHRVYLAYDEEGTAEERGWVENLAREYPSIGFGPTPNRRGAPWMGFSRRVRLSADFLRFLRPEFAHCADLRRRAARRAPRPFVFLSRLALVRSDRGRTELSAALKRVERAIPSSREIEAFIASHDPDLVLFTPLLKLGSIQPDYLKSAQALGLRTMLCVASWDNLSSKSLIRFPPDAVTVWNDVQKREAIELHGVPPERVVVTGAQNFDPWFAWKPRPREEFCRRVGLEPEKPYLLYVCSALFAANIKEAAFVQDWIRRLRGSSDPRVREAGILIRPHPKRGAEWNNVEFESFANAAIWPRGGSMPIDREAKADYYDSMFHSAAVVGLNTTALIEAGVVGRPVHTLLAPEFSGSQTGTLHFAYLMEIEGGLLRVAGDFDEHVRHLSEALQGINWGEAQRRRFLEVFVRPYGLDVTSTSVFLNAIELLAKGEPPKPVRPSMVDRALRLGLYPLRRLARILRGARIVAKSCAGWRRSGLGSSAVEG
jgi:hypothetical protein